MLISGVFFQRFVLIAKFASEKTESHVFKADEFKINKENSHYYMRMVFLCA
jgi:hypothetical protein